MHAGYRWLAPTLTAQSKIALIVGANSAIARAIARRLSAQGYALLLMARDEPRLKAFICELQRDGATVLESFVVDLCAYRQAEAVFADLGLRFRCIELALICHGMMRTNTDCHADFEQFRASVETNFCSVAWCMQKAFALLRGQAGAELVVLSSVSGDRGRARNYFYGSTKAAINTFAAGMRMENRGCGVNIVCVKPGPVATPMGTVASRGRWMSTDVDTVARIICASLGRGKHTVYVPGFWRYLMWIVRCLPESLLFRLHV